MISSRRCLEAPHQLGLSATLILNLPPSWGLRALPAHTSPLQARNQNSPQFPLVLPFTSPRQGPPRRWPRPQEQGLLLPYLFALLPLLLLLLEVLFPLQTLPFCLFPGSSFSLLFLPKTPGSFKQLDSSLPS